MIARLVSFWRNRVHRKRVDADLDEELRGAFDQLIEEKLRSGASPEAARRAARLELGSLQSLKEGVGDVRAGAGLDVLLQDVRFALRQFRRAPGFTAVAILTLALGIGANAAIFGVVKSVLLDALPYADADRLARVYASPLDGAKGWIGFNGGMLEAVLPRQQSFSSLHAFAPTRDAVLGGEDFARVVTIAWVEPRLFETLGVSAALGRTFRDDDRAVGHVPASGAEVGPDTARFVIVTHSAWRRLFLGDPAIVGRDVRLNGIQRTVVGVLPHDFVGPMGAADFFLAFDIRPALARGVNWLGLVGRLKAGVSQEAARREIAAVWASRDDPKFWAGLGVTAMPLRDAMVGGTRTPLLVLLASAGLVLLIACANLAGALLSRGISRRKEFAVRVALGAGRRRLVRQLLTESVVLALCGGAAGLLLAQSLLALLRGVLRSLLPAYVQLSLDPGAVLVTGLLAVGTGLAFGLAPALSIGRSDAQGALRDDARGASEGQRPRRLRGVLVAGQLALCASLLTGAGLLARSLWEMARTPLGYDASSVLVGRLRLSTPDYPTLQQRSDFRDQLAEKLRSLPGVEAVATANKVPTVETPRQDPLVIDGAEPVSLSVAYAGVSDDYFRTLRIPLRQGRTFDTSDRVGTPATVVVSESLARRYWPDGRALGARVTLGGVPVEVVGVVGDVRNDLARPDAEPMAYRSHRQESTQRFGVFIRTHGDPLAFLKPLQREVATLDPTLPVQQPMTLESAVGGGLAGRRLPVLLMTAFSALALLLASVGVYGMFASMAAAREREFGVRMALGSRPSAIARLILRQGAGWMAAGLSGGALGMILVVQLLRGWLYGVPPFDPIALGGAVLMQIGCGALALLIPLRRATRVDPMVALRAD